MKRQAKISNPASHSSFVLSPFSAYFDTAISLFLFVVSSKSPKFWELSRSQARWQLTRDSRSIFYRKTRSQKSEKIFFQNRKRRLKIVKLVFLNWLNPDHTCLASFGTCFFAKQKFFDTRFLKWFIFPRNIIGSTVQLINF